ncbi:hypothetical protein O3M35_004165 [Rhynocoris fuscipes]|uniref:CAAX prenyl protease 2 n=1 Tax=Rhynocoris fuscipes TaxID=488301 RepID=A0AAW1CGF8_9HEMI
MTFVRNYNCPIQLLGCSFLSLTYVLSLYVWRTNSHRNHPTTVKRRFLSVLIMAVISPMFVAVFTYCGASSTHTIWELLGLRLPGLFMAATVPLLLTMVLFLGPLVMQKQSDTWLLYSDSMYWMNNLKNLLWLRDHIIAPLSEELTFRACMLPLLIQCFRPQNAVFICPLFFGIAHLHHVYGRIKSGITVKYAIIFTGFQVLYTTLFGAYSAFLFLRTGHFIAPFLAHAFCNHMGFPDFYEVINYPEPKRMQTFFFCILGLISWCFLLSPLTNPNLYNNNIYWQT